jgi:hypothetical protein
LTVIIDPDDEADNCRLNRDEGYLHGHSHDNLPLPSR